MIAGQELAPDAMQPPDGLDSELFPFTPGTDLLIITMPAPQHSTEAYYIGIVAPHPHDEKTIRYFVLSHSDANKNAGMAPGCIRELTSDGKNFRSMDFVKPTKIDFIMAMRVLCGDKPSGSFCIVPPRRCSQVEESGEKEEA
ncbi:MAG: hypothetical protein D4R65_11440 [Verrucomicrobiaceae bacterium]|nr:MAG: hypothetical protein D4R65_11440 [Verrucomicrobiaceae bacterium]